MDAFGPLLRQEAIRRRLAATADTVYIVDGAVGLAAMSAANFPNATQIVDFYHRMQHASRLIEALSAAGPSGVQATLPALEASIAEEWGKVADCRDAGGGATQLGRNEIVNKALHYFTENVDRMQHRTFQKKGFSIGSGVVEAGCKTVMASDASIPACTGVAPGPSNILDLRCLQQRRRVEAPGNIDVTTSPAAPIPFL